MACNSGNCDYWNDCEVARDIAIQSPKYGADEESARSKAGEITIKLAVFQHYAADCVGWNKEQNFCSNSVHINTVMNELGGGMNGSIPLKIRGTFNPVGFGK